MILKLLPFLALGLAAYGTAGFYSKQYVQNPSWQLFTLISLIYIGATYGWLKAVEITGVLFPTNVMWSATAILSVMVTGMLIFHDRPSPLQWAGCLMAIFGIILISIPSK